MVNERLARDEVLMGTALLWAQRGTCSRRKVGVVLERDGRILVTGYNGAPSGMPHCYHGPHDNPASPCLKSVHAEVNAIAYAARWGISLEGSTMWSTCMPCPACALLIVSSGMVQVNYGEDYWDKTGRDTLVAGGLTLVDMSDRMTA